MAQVLERWRKVDGILRAGGWAWIIFCWITGLTGAAVIAWASTTWSWYWTTFSWAGVAGAFLFALMVLTVSFFLTGLAVRAFRLPEKSDADPLPSDNPPEHRDKIFAPTISQSPPALAAGLYVSDIR